MIKEENIDIFSLNIDEYYFAHCVSADFEMGAGIAVEFNNRFNLKRNLTYKYPKEIYLSAWSSYGGDCILEGKVFNLVTKERYFLKPTYKSLRLSLEKMKEICISQGIHNIAMPRIGCGLDKLSWNKVYNIIKEIFDYTDIDILICSI